MLLFQYPQFGATVHVELWSQIINAALLRARLIKAATIEGEEGDLARDTVNFGFVEAKMITSETHLQTAIYQALLADEQNQLRTKTVHSEILWALNPTSNISEAIRRYGVSDTSTSLVVVRITKDANFSAPPPSTSIRYPPPSAKQSNEIMDDDIRIIMEEDVRSQMEEVILGEASSFDLLKGITDWSAVKKYYKLNTELAITSAKGDVEREHAAIDTIVTSSVAMKSVMA